MIYEFGQIHVDTELFELKRNDKLVHVEPKVFTLLQYLLENPHKVITHDELVDTVWKGRIVSDAALMTAIANARKALGDSGTKQHFIKTVRGRGIRFVADTTRSNNALPSVSDERTLPDVHGISSEPVLLILPFRSTTRSTDADEFVLAMASSLEIVLLRIPLLQLKSFSLLNIDADTASGNGSALAAHGIDYLLEGLVMQQQGALSIRVQLSDAATGVQVWAEQFHIAGDYATALEAGVVQVIKKLEPQLHRVMYERAVQIRATSEDANSRVLYLEASGILALKGWHHDSFTSASKLLRKSRQVDPQFSHAASYLSLVLSLGYRLGLLKSSKDTVNEAIDAAESALALDGMDSRVLGLVGCAFGDLGDTSRALPLLRNAVELNPQNAQALSALGAVCLTTRQVDSAISNLRAGIKISPLDSRLCIWGSLLSTALRFKGKTEEALAEAQLACQRDHRAYMPRVVLAGTHLSMGDEKSAATSLADAIRIKPNLSDNQIRSLLGKRLGNELISAR